MVSFSCCWGGVRGDALTPERPPFGRVGRAHGLLSVGVVKLAYALGEIQVPSCTSNDECPVFFSCSSPCPILLAPWQDKAAEVTEVITVRKLPGVSSPTGSASKSALVSRKSSTGALSAAENGAALEGPAQRGLAVAGPAELEAAATGGAEPAIGARRGPWLSRRWAVALCCFAVVACVAEILRDLEEDALGCVVGRLAPIKSPVLSWHALMVLPLLH